MPKLVDDRVPAYLDIMEDGKLVGLRGFGEVKIHLIPGGTEAPFSIAAEIQDYGGNFVAAIVEPEARRTGSPEWEGREEAFKEAIRAFAEDRGVRTPGPQRPSAPCHIFFDPGRETQTYEGVRNA